MPLHGRIGELERKVDRLELLTRVALLSNEPRQRDETLRLALREICSHAGWAIGHVWWVEPSGAVVDATVEPSRIWYPADPGRYGAFVAATESEGAVSRRGEGLPGRVLAGTAAEWIEDLASDPEDRRKALAAEAGLRSAMAFPLFVGETVEAVLEFHSEQRQPVDAELLEVMRSVGILLGRVIERAAAGEAHRRVEKILELASHAFVAMDAEGRIVSWNAAAERIFGHPPRAAIGRTVAELLVPERLREAHRSGMERYLRTGHGTVLTRPVELPALHADGHELPVEITVTAMQEDGTTTFFAFLQDITERRRAESELRRRERQLAEAHAIARLGSFEWDIANDRVTWSDTLYRVYELDPSSFSPTFDGFLELLHPDDRERTALVIRATCERGTSFSDRHRIVTGDGRTRHLEARGEVQRDATGAAVRLAGTCQDVTELVEAEQHERKLLRARNHAQLLRRLNSEMQQFVYAASHDLQEPLRTIAGYLQLLDRRHVATLGGEAKEFIDFALGAAHRMQGLLEGLLRLSRVTTRGGDRELVELNEVLEDVKQNLTLALEEARTDIRQVALPAVWADRVQMLQLFQNLLGNALKFRGDRPARIEIDCEEGATAWRISVRDHGVGFEPKHAERIFAVFQRLHGARFGGTGIGLAICRKIVEYHGGRIWAQARPDAGATFFVELPKHPNDTLGELPRAADDEAGESTDRGRAASSAGPDRASEPAAPRQRPEQQQGREARQQIAHEADDRDPAPLRRDVTQGDERRGHEQRGEDDGEDEAVRRHGVRVLDRGEPLVLELDLEVPALQLGQQLAQLAGDLAHEPHHVGARIERLRCQALRRQPLEGQPAQHRSRRVGELEVRVEVAHRALERPQRLEHEEQLGGDATAVRGGDLEQAHDELAHLEPAQRPVEVPVEQLGDVGLDQAPVGLALGAGQAEERVRHGLLVALDHRPQQVGHAIARPPVEAADLTQVDEADDVARQHEQIPGVGVRVEEAVDEDL